jgi:hypothetical protein
VKEKMKFILILSLFLSLVCKKKEEPTSVEPAKQEIKQAQEDTVYYPAILKPCVDGSHYKITKELDDLKSCTNINRNDLFGEKEYFLHQFAFINGSNVNVRKGPGKEFEKIGTVEITYMANILAYEMDSTKAKWYLIFSPPSGFYSHKEVMPVFGWVNSEYVSIPSDFVEPVEIIPAKIEFDGVDGQYEYTFNADGTCIDTYDTKPEYGGRTSREGKIFRHKDLIWCRQKKREPYKGIFFYFRDGKYRPEFSYQGLD